MASVGLTAAQADSQFMDSDVTLEDQNMINRFARLNVKEEELQTQLKDLKRQLENMEEASSELILADDDFDDLEDAGGDSAGTQTGINFRIGESFMVVSKDDAEQLLETQRQELKAKIKTLEAECAPMKEEMETIKATLYAKFGNNINLDHDE